MYEKLKEMQIQGIFKMINGGTKLDTLIANASSFSDIKDYLKEISNYIKDLNDEFSKTYYVSIGSSISDFNDKIYYELYNMKEAAKINGVYTKELDYNKAGTMKLGLKSDNVIFSLEEQKLISLINHYYISLKANNKYDDKLLYIPLDNLKLIFTKGTNKARAKELIVNACCMLNEKQIYWDISKTTYAKKKKFSDKKLLHSSATKMVDLVPLYAPWGENEVSMLGFICKITDFLRLRYAFNQITNYLPTKCLERDYYDYVISRRILYYLTLKRQKEKVGLYKKALSKLALELYTEDLSSSYLSIIKHDNHKPRKQKEFLSSLINLAYDYLMNSSYFDCRWYLEVNNAKVRLLTLENKPREIDNVFSELSKIIGNCSADVEKINKLCEKISKIEDLDIAILVNKLNTSGIINKRNVDKYVSVSSTDNGISIENLRDALIDDLYCSNTKIYKELINGQLELIIEAN